MSNPSRREFLGYAGGLGAFALMPTERTTPELVLYNGNIITMDTRPPGAGFGRYSSRGFATAIRYRGAKAGHSCHI
jgi:hypothetical protein